MLSDGSRKLFRILYNYLLKNNDYPKIKDLNRMTGKTDYEIYEYLKELEKNNYILWPNKQDYYSIVLLDEEDRKPNAPKRSRTLGRSIAYWINH